MACSMPTKYEEEKPCSPYVVMNNLFGSPPIEILNLYFRQFNCDFDIVLFKVFLKLFSPYHYHFGRHSPLHIMWFFEKFTIDQLFNFDGIDEKTVNYRKIDAAEVISCNCRCTESNFEFCSSPENRKEKEHWDMIKNHPTGKAILALLPQK
jgi:hypothetical protein